MKRQWKADLKIELMKPYQENIKQSTGKVREAMKRAVVRGMTLGASYVQKDLKVALDKALESKTWDWPNVTLRQNGETVRSPRNIVDTGKLKASLAFKERNFTTKTTIEIIYKTPYAAIVHYGGKIRPYGDKRRDPVFIPGRPWVMAVFRGTHGIDKFDIRTPYEKGVLEAWQRQFGK